ncbi:MAG: PspA/IM30 family protein [Cytophagales bacterium]|nr:MAG: PspA/IM30 family protein [Cytophagales bacterium]
MWGKLFQRFLNIFKAKANDALDRAEDPVQMMKLAIAEMELSIKNSTEALAKAMGNGKQLKNKLDELNKEALGWYGKATQAIKTGNDDLGKKALEKKSLLDGQIEQYQGMVEHSNKTVDQLKVQLDRMKTKLDEAKSKESILTAKVQNAKAHKEIGAQLGGIGDSPLADFKKYEDKINKLEAEAEAYTELSEHTGKLDREFEVLLTDSKVVGEFDAIKADLLALEERKKNEELEKKDKKIAQHFNETQKLNSAPKPIQLAQNTEDKQKMIDNFFKKD